MDTFINFPVSVATEQENLAFMIFSGPNDRLSHQIYEALIYRPSSLLVL